MRIHILGICGTFMGGVAALAKAAGHKVSGCDANVYPPMSTQLETLGISLYEGYSQDQAALEVDQFIIGNAMSRGNPLLEAIMSAGKPYCSGPEWLAREVLGGREVIAVAGTHGKTTTSSLVAHLLAAAGHDVGFLIGGVPSNFGLSARLGSSPYFIVEADEYDTAFFDKRAKFVHYRPRYAVLNNLEFDHADIYASLADIKRQFHHLIRTVPANGKLFVNDESEALDDVLAMGCWTEQRRFGHRGKVSTVVCEDNGQIVLRNNGGETPIQFSMSGIHNQDNAAAAAAVASELGVSDEEIAAGLAGFKGVARRQQLLLERDELMVYDDFAHHPTAIALTLQGFRNRFPGSRLLAVLEPRSNTMKAGVHKETLAEALDDADLCFVYRPEELEFDLARSLGSLRERLRIFDSYTSLENELLDEARAGDIVVLMSNGGFGNLRESIPRQLALSKRFDSQ